MKRLLTTIFVLLLTCEFLTAQSNLTNRRSGISKEPTNCETNEVFMDSILALMEEEPNPASNIILIARLGRREKNRDLNRRRLFNVSTRYKIYKLPTEKIVLAEAEKTQEFGRVEIYWNGEMITALVARRNRDICVSSDSFDKRYYPDKK